MVVGKLMHLNAFGRMVGVMVVCHIYFSTVVQPAHRRITRVRVPYRTEASFVCGEGSNVQEPLPAR